MPASPRFADAALMPQALSFSIEPGGCLRGTIRVPGDKSISHRSVILASIAEGESTISGFLQGEDTLATAAAFRAMGVPMQGPEDGALSITGVGLWGLRAPPADLDLGNSGTAMRLLPGVLAAQAFDVLRLAPPLIVTRDEIDTAVSTIATCLEESS